MTNRFSDSCSKPLCSLRLEGGPPPRWSCYMLAVGILPVNLLLETSPPPCWPPQTPWKGWWTCRVKQPLKPQTASKSLHHLRCLSGRLACKRQKPLIDILFECPLPSEVLFNLPPQQNEHRSLESLQIRSKVAYKDGEETTGAFTAQPQEVTRERTHSVTHPDTHTHTSSGRCRV